MSTSLLYHAFGLKGVKYISTKYIAGSVIFHAEVTHSIERCLFLFWTWVIGITNHMPKGILSVWCYSLIKGLGGTVICKNP